MSLGVPGFVLMTTGSSLVLSFLSDFLTAIWLPSRSISRAMTQRGPWIRFGGSLLPNQPPHTERISGQFFVIEALFPLHGPAPSRSSVLLTIRSSPTLCVIRPSMMLLIGWSFFKAVPTWLTYMCSTTDTEGRSDSSFLLPPQIPRAVFESCLLPL